MHTAAKLQRRSAKLKAEIALKVVSGASRAELATRHGVTDEELDSWVATFVAGGRDAFTNRRDDVSKDQEIARLHQKIGELVMRLDQAPNATMNGQHNPEDEEN